MIQRGKKSAVALAVVSIEHIPRLKPPNALTNEQRSVWVETTNARPADWFGREQIPLLEAYCRHVAYGRMISAELNRAEPEWLTDDDGLRRHKTLLEIHEKESRAMSSLATRLRLTSQSLHDKRVSGRASDGFKGGNKPWQVSE